MVSIIISWRDRAELGETIPTFLAEVTPLNGEIVVVNYGGKSADLIEQLGKRNEKVRVVEVPNRLYFNKAAAHNVGAYLSAHPFLFFCDCDIILANGILSNMVHMLLPHSLSFLTIAGVRETKQNSRGANFITRFGYELLIRTANGRELRIFDHEEDAQDGSRHAPGLLLVRRDHFLAINGYNSRLDGWGWEDQDMLARLTLGAGLTRMFHGQVLHISHGDDARVGAYPYRDRWESRDRMFRRCLARYDVADFTGTYDVDTRELCVDRGLEVGSSDAVG